MIDRREVPAPASDLTARADETLDTLLRDRVRLLQSRKGYRTSVDAMALAWFACERQPDARRCVDLGAGSGLVSILVGLRRPDVQLVLIERQPELAARAQRNLVLNGLESRANLLLHDLADPLTPADLARLLRDCPRPPSDPCTVDLVVCNPPYFRLEGRDPPRNPERHAAHCETTAPVERFCAVAAGLLGAQGVACFVYPAEGSARLTAGLTDAGLGDVEIYPLLHRENDPAPVRVLVRARRGIIFSRHGPTLYLHPHGARDEVYADAIEAFLASL